MLLINSRTVIKTFWAFFRTLGLRLLSVTAMLRSVDFFGKTSSSSNPTVDKTPCKTQLASAVDKQPYNTQLTSTVDITPTKRD